ncbi:hypothetical protein [Flavivirga jejuensis]|uniref:Uncharacterized protein n=1 Tax=Flavivirga jejuensis TaxID=870487 RepID=A0ABT8WQA2_9FLAO|nr:hypothetical protein [Flavivirga jejuensis]MDO5975205.1 hypothetical protein [Flavivirga jejuensis]
MTNSSEFWCKYTDRQILEAIKRYLYQLYGFKKDSIPKIKDEFLKNIYFSTHVLEFLIDESWAVFNESIWNIKDFYQAIGYFNGRFLNKLEKKITYYDPYEDDSVQEFVIDTQLRLDINISEAMRLHQSKFDSIISELELLIQQNKERRDNIYIEKWKQ